MKIITAINAGSSSLKVSIYEGENGEPEEIAVAQVDGLTAPPPSFRYKSASEHVRKELKNVDGPEDAFDYILNYLTTESGPPQLRHKDDISYVCHRVVHGGDYRTAVPIEDDTLSQLEKLSDLAPL